MTVARPWATEPGEAAWRGPGGGVRAGGGGSSRWERGWGLGARPLHRPLRRARPARLPEPRRSRRPGPSARRPRGPDRALPGPARRTPAAPRRPQPRPCRGEEGEEGELLGDSRACRVGFKDPGPDGRELLEEQSL